MRRGVWWWALGLGVFGCDPDYPVSATFCDDWCEFVTKACPSPYDPGKCVAGCEQDELSNTAYPCRAEAQALVDCAKAPPHHDFVCVSEPHDESPCNVEQDAFYVCINGGPEGIVAANCSYHCLALEVGRPDRAPPSCEDDCIARGLGNLACEAARNEASSCLWEYCGAEGAVPEYCSDNDCEEQLAALDACGANALANGD